MLIAPRPGLFRIPSPPLPTCPLWIQPFDCGMPSSFPPLLHTPTPPRHLCFGGFSLFLGHFYTRAPAPFARTTGDGSRARGLEWMAHLHVSHSDNSAGSRRKGSSLSISSSAAAVLC